MRLIPLSQGMFAKVSDEDYERVSKWKWYARKTGNTYYAVRNILSGKKNPLGCVYMHREILESKPGEHTDHKDGDGLNNTRENIRSCSRYENNISFRNLRRTKTVKYRGVTPKRKRFRARITFQKTEICIGVFDTPEQAAKAYDARAMVLFGSFASLNFPTDTQQRFADS